MESAQAFLDHVEDLTDLELAILLSLVAQDHCLVITNDECLDDLASELALVGHDGACLISSLTPDKIVRDMFNLSYIILDRDDLQSIDAFGSAILDDDSNDPDDAAHDPDGDLGTVCGHSILTDLLSNRVSARHFQHETCNGRLPSSVFESSRASEIRHQESGQRCHREGIQPCLGRCPNPGS